MIGSKFVASSILAAAAVGSIAIAVAQTQPSDTSRTPDAAVAQSQATTPGSAAGNDATGGNAATPSSSPAGGDQSSSAPMPAVKADRN